MALRTPAPQKDPYDQRGNQDSLPPSDEGLRHLTGINSDEEKAMDARAKEALADREEAGDDFSYRPTKTNAGAKKQPNDDGWSFKRFRQRRKTIMMATLISSIVIAVLVGMFGLLGSLKLDSLMSNIDAKTFARLQGVEDRRSMAWMQAYMEMRLMDMGNNPDMTPGKEQNMLFRSGRVSTGNPIGDWYRTLRTSKFEQDVFEKNGIKFMSVFTPDGKVRPGYVDINGVKSEIPIEKLTDSDITKLQRGDPATLNKYHDYIGSEFFNNDKEARRAIRQVVNDNTRNWQVFKRRHIRKDIQNMVGVRDWRFFENTRNKIDEKKINIRNKIIDKAVPDSTKSGKFIKCLFGISECSFSEDPANPENEADGVLDDSVTNQEGYDEQTKDNKVVPSAEKVDLGPAADLVKKIASGAVPVLDALNIVQLLDSFSHIDNAIHHHLISKGVEVAKGVQAMGVYQVFETARDQIKSGDANSAEVNKFMQLIGPATASEGWTKVVQGEGDPSKQSAGSQAYCSDENQKKIANDATLASQQFAYSCPTQKIGSSNNAAELESAYNNYMGPIVGPILSAYNSVRHVPVFGKLVDFLNRVTGKLTSLLTDTIIKTLGVQGDLKQLMGYVAGKLATFLGAGPIPLGSSGNTMMNWVVQGAAYTAESSARSNGASLTTSQSKATAMATLAQYTSDQAAQQSLYDKVASLSNPDSLGSKSVMAFSNLNLSSFSNLFSNFGQIFKTIGSTLTLPFSHKLGAAAPDGYAGAQFAGIQTFDFPQECDQMDPLTANPWDGTNIQQVLPNVSQSELTWDLVTDSSKWYPFVFSKLSDDQRKDPDSITEKIYNCHLLDTSVSGSLGYLYGYTDDNGLNESDGSTTGTVPTDTAGSTLDMANIFQPSDNISCAPGTKDLGIQDGYHEGQVVKIRICAVPTIHSTSQESNDGFGVIGADGGVVVNSRVSGAVLAMAAAAKASGITLTANSGFRTMSHQQSLCPCDGVTVAIPGTSNHQMGLAIDFGGGLPATPGPIAGNAFWNWLSANASKFGYQNYPREAWHWSPTGN
jgi:hypothetical protein